MRLLVLSTALLAGLSVGAPAAEPTSSGASNIAPQNTKSTIAPALPNPDVAPGTTASDALHAAEGALATGQLGQAQQSLEMAETRMLDRSVPLGQTNNPSDNPAIRDISGALQALAANDRPGCMRLIEAALESARTQGL